MKRSNYLAISKITASFLAKETLMASNFQDDARENDMIKLFDLHKNEEEGRSGIDAFLDFKDQLIPFELKTTSQGSVTTVRDFGEDHIKKWENKHWLIGFFIQGREYYKYGSPLMMADWIQEKAQYIAPDLKLAALVPSRINLEDLHKILGEKKIYTYKDAKSLQKNQYSKKEYLELQDLSSGYSPNRMLELLKARAQYLVKRGSTLNNPHIPFGYFKSWPEITENHAQALRLMVEESLKLNG